MPSNNECRITVQPEGMHLYNMAVLYTRGHVDATIFLQNSRERGLTDGRQLFLSISKDSFAAAIYSRISVTEVKHLCQDPLSAIEVSEQVTTWDSL